MRGRHAIFVAVALVLAISAGAVVGAVAQIGAVDEGDPRTGPIPSPSPTPVPTFTATPTPRPTPSATPSPSPERADVWLYTLAEGDSLSRIAIRFGTTTEDLLTLNPEYADNQDLIEVGAQIIVPCTPLAVAEDRC